MRVMGVVLAVGFGAGASCAGPGKGAMPESVASIPHENGTRAKPGPPGEASEHLTPPPCIGVPAPPGLTMTYLYTRVMQWGYPEDPNFREMDVIRLKNDTPYTFEYDAESPTWVPWVRQRWTGDEWKRQDMVVCRDVWKTHRLAPGQHYDLDIHSTRWPNQPAQAAEWFPPEGQLSRVGLSVTNVGTGEEVVAWSEPYFPQPPREDAGERSQ